MKKGIQCAVLMLVVVTQLSAQGAREAGSVDEVERKDSAQAAAQNRRIYLDAHATVLRLVNQHTISMGIGSRVGYDLTKNFAVEAEVNFFPDKDWIEGEGGRKTQGLLRLKMGKRFERVGFFAKAGPGFISMSAGRAVLVTNRAGCNGQTGSFSCFEPRRTNTFIGDVGGVVEIYTSSRTFIRFDAGNTIQATSGYHNNFQTSSGFGFRF
jgi:hypothetical protein